MRRGVFGILMLALVAVGCGTTAPGVDVREAHLARVPANAEFVAQMDLAKLVETADVEQWLSWMARIEEQEIDTNCVSPLLQHAQILTEITIPGTPAYGDGALVLVSGEVTAADIAACATKLMGGPNAAPPTPSTDGTFQVGEGHETAYLADVQGLGVAIGTAAGLALARSAAPAAPQPGSEMMARLRTLLGARGDLDAFLLRPIGGEDLPVDAAGLVLRRGATDRYEAVLVAGSADAASALSLAVMALPLMIAQVEAMAQERANDPEGLPMQGEMIAHVQPILAAVREALTNAQVTTENDVVRVVVDVDPAKASPSDIMMVAGMMLFMRGVGAVGPADVDAGSVPTPVPLERTPVAPEPPAE